MISRLELIAKRAKICSRYSGLTSSTRRAVTLLAGGTGAAQLIVVVSAPLLTRLYVPADYGVLAVFSSLVVIWLAVATLRYDVAVTMPGDSRVAVSLARVSLTVAVFMSLMSFLFVALFNGYIAAMTDASQAERLLWLLPFAVLGGGAYQTLYFLAIRGSLFGAIARTKVTQSLVRVGVQALGGVVCGSPLGLVIGDVIGRGAGAGTLAKAVGRCRALAQPSLTVRELWSVAVRYRRFPLLSSPGALLNVIGLQATPLLVAWILGPRDAGLFVLTQRVVGLPMAVIGVAIGEAYLSTAPSLARTNRAALASLFRRTLVRLLALALLPASALAIAGPSLFALIFGPDWEAAGEYARILVPAFVLQLATSPLSQTPNILERQDLQLAADIVRAASVVSVFAVSNWADWSAGVTMGALSAALCLGYLTQIGIARLSLKGAPGTTRQT